MKFVLKLQMRECGEVGRAEELDGGRCDGYDAEIGCCHWAYIEIGVASAEAYTGNGGATCTMFILNINASIFLKLKYTN